MALDEVDQSIILGDYFEVIVSDRGNKELTLVHHSKDPSQDLIVKFEVKQDGTIHWTGLP